jgi:hypothetical protein
MALKHYTCIRPGRGRNFPVGLGKRVFVCEGFATEDEEIQETIENSKSFKTGYIKLVDGPQEDDCSEDEIKSAVPGKRYGLNDLKDMTVPELRGIAATQGVKWEGLKKAEIIKALMGG